MSREHEKAPTGIAYGGPESRRSEREVVLQDVLRCVERHLVDLYDAVGLVIRHPLNEEDRHPWAALQGLDLIRKGYPAIDTLARLDRTPANISQPLVHPTRTSLDLIHASLDSESRRDIGGCDLELSAVEREESTAAAHRSFTEKLDNTI